MAEKTDHYTVLGVEKTASLDEIKAAFKKIAMKNHPDMLRNKTEAEKKAAGEKFQLAKEAHDVLTDSAKRATYDKYGHKGVENLKSSSPSKEGGASVPWTAPPRKVPTVEDVFAFFDTPSAQNTGPATPGNQPRETPAQRAARAAEERQKAREEARNRNREAAASTPPAPDAFQDVSKKVEDATARLRDAAAGKIEISAGVLERFRENLQDLLNEIDTAIRRTRKKDGPRP